jgi:hypothetical protein
MLIDLKICSLATLLKIHNLNQWSKLTKEKLWEHSIKDQQRALMFFKADSVNNQ